MCDLGKAANEVTLVMNNCNAVTVEARKVVTRPSDVRLMVTDLSGFGRRLSH